MAKVGYPNCRVLSKSKFAVTRTWKFPRLYKALQLYYYIGLYNSFPTGLITIRGQVFQLILGSSLLADLNSKNSYLEGGKRLISDSDCATAPACT